jgi:hypothetical protein
MSLPVSAAFRAAVTESHVYARELWACSSDFARIERLPIDASTSLSVSANLVRRSGTIVLPNADGRYTPGAGVVDFDRPFLLRFGVRVGMSWEWCEQPLLWPDQDESDVGARTVTLAVSDGMRIVASDAQLTAPLSFAAGTAIAAMIRAALVARGAPDDDRYFDLDDGGALLPADAGYESGARWADVISQWLTDYSLDLWAAPPLVYTLRPVPVPGTTDPVASWARGTGVRVLGLKARRTNLARNHAIVSGVAADGTPISAEEYDTNPASPVCWGKPGVGDLLVTYQSDGLATVAQCAAVAASLLISRAAQVEIEATVPVDPSLDRRDVVTVDDPEAGVSGRFVLDSFPVPVQPGSQTITVRNDRSLT